MHAADGAVRRARLGRRVLAPDVLDGIIGERRARIAALLRAVVHEAVFADVQVAGAGAALPVIRAPFDQVALEIVDARVQALAELHALVVDGALAGVERLQLARLVVEDADRRREAERGRAARDLERVFRPLHAGAD